jgi:5-methylcytosine-specific restriction endonuclease McrA
MVKKIKKIKEKTRWANFSKEYRNGKVCSICGSDKNLNVHHIIGRHVIKSKFKYEPNNLIVLCPKCHKFGFKSAHVNPVWFAWWLEKFHPAKYEWVIHTSNFYLKIN